MSSAERTGPLPGCKRSREACDEPDRRQRQQQEFYKMDHSKTGLAVIFNIEQFKNPAYNRQGSSRDRDCLVESFTMLGFELLICNNSPKDYIENTLNDVSKRDFSDSDCFVLVYMSHGNEGLLLSWDEPFHINLLWDNFTAERCPSLKNKPKLFFIQACQGPKRDRSVAVDTEDKCDQCSGVDTQDVDFLPSYSVPNTADFLLAMSTVPGYVSYRNIISGSLFIQELCNTLNRDAYNMDILSVLTYVDKRVALGYEFRRDDQTFKQQPMFLSTLLRGLKFSPKSESAPPEKKYKLDSDQVQVEDRSVRDNVESYN